MEYKGYRYEQETDYEDDNIKLWHTAITPTGERLSIPFSPYMHPTAEDFAAWVDLGCPSRDQVQPVTGGNILRSSDLERLKGAL